MLKKFKKMKGFIGLLMLGLSFLGAMGHAELLSTPSNDKWATDGEVRSIVQLGSRIYLGGTFTHVGPVTGGGVPLDSITGAKGADFPQVKGKINGVVADGKGGWFIGGSFTHVNNVTQSNLAHILSNGTLDSQWHPYANDTVSALVVSEDTVFVAGRFTSVNGTARNCLAAINAVSGALDTRWVPPPPNAFSEVNSLVVYGGKVYLGGSFTSMGVTTRHRLAALDAGNGALDPLWNPNADNDVHTLAVSGSRIYVGGMFTSMSGTTRHYLAAVDAVSGVLDTQWTPPQVNGYVQTLYVYGSRVYVGGRFLSMGGLPRNNLAAVDVVTGDVDLRWDPNANGDVLTLATSGSRVYVGGLFASMGGKQRNYLAAVDAMTGDVDDSWNPNPISSVNALVVSAQKIFVGGSFWLMGDVPRNRLAAVNAVTGELDTEWNPSRVSSGWGPVLALSLNGPRLSVGDSPGFGWFLDPSRPYAPDAGAISKVSAKGVQAYWDFSSLAESYTLAASLSLVLPPISPLLKTGITSLTDSVAGLTPNTTYYLWVNASNVIGVSDYTFLGSTLTLSAIPESFQASGISSTRAMLSWTANGNPNNTIYTLQESSDGGLNFTTIFTGSSRDVFLTNLTEGTRYLFRVFSQNVAGVSSEPTNMVLWTLVDAPARGRIVETMAGNASAQWEASQGATSYTLSASLRPEIPPTSPLLKTGITALTDSVPGLTPNTTYYFSVSACLETFCSAYTALGSTITLSAIPTDFMVSGISSTGATFSWAANGNPNNTTYVLEESPDEGLIYSPIYTGIVPTVSLTNLTAGTRYLFRVLSQNVAGFHSSPTAPVAVISPPSAPASGSITGITISGTSAQWIESVGATRYTLAASVTPTLPGTFPFNKLGITELTATLTGLAPNTPYSLWVSACNETGCSTYLALGSTVTLPAAPTSLRVKSTTDDTVTLAWNSGGNPAGTIYVIQQSAQGDLDYSEVARVTSTEATIRNLEEQTTYSFRVLVLGVSGELSVLSSEIGTTTSPKYIDVAQIRYYPNPSHGPMTFDHLPEGVTITIHTMIGQRVRQMTVPASEILEWDGKSDSGESVASGVYLVRATGAGNKTFKIVIQR